MRRYAITPGVLAPGTGLVGMDRLLGRVADLAADGVELLLLREKALGVGELTELTQQVVAVTAGSGMRIVLPGGLPQVAGVGAHLSAARFDQEKKPAPAGWFSVSCHDLDEVTWAVEVGADAILFAPVFGKTLDETQVVPAAGLDRLSAACARAEAVAVFALGGVNPANAPSCIKAGATGVAGIRMFFGGDE